MNRDAARRWLERILGIALLGCMAMLWTGCGSNRELKDQAEKQSRKDFFIAVSPGSGQISGSGGATQALEFTATVLCRDVFLWSPCDVPGYTPNWKLRYLEDWVNVERVGGPLVQQLFRVTMNPQLPERESSTISAGGAFPILVIVETTGPDGYTSHRGTSTGEGQFWARLAFDPADAPRKDLPALSP